MIQVLYQKVSMMTRVTRVGTLPLLQGLPVLRPVDVCPSVGLHLPLLHDLHSDWSGRTRNKQTLSPVFRKKEQQTDQMSDAGAVTVWSLPPVQSPQDHPDRAWCPGGRLGREQESQSEVKYDRASGGGNVPVVLSVYHSLHRHRARREQR